ncbi:MAG: glycoside hydrolase family 3 protein [Treponema sp.]|nr:glycoside hydrolase family 3 protein [Treponema sp.]
MNRCRGARAALCAASIFWAVCSASAQGGARRLPSDPRQLPADVTFWSDYPSDVLAATLVSRMTDAELLAQIFMFGWAGAEPDDLLYQWVDRGLGSVKVFGWNTDDIYLVAQSIASLQRRALRNRFNIPLFVATDQEGGWIRHVKGATSITPGNMAIGASGYPIDAWYSAYYISREIKALGINMNFAPVVDLYTDYDSPIISTRAFSDSPEASGILGNAFVMGSMAAGVIPTAKHFPGHGDTNNDSHTILPIIDIDYDTFVKRELAPFAYLVERQVPAIMSGHLAFPKIDQSGAPASLSKYFLTDLLRGELGYTGLIITDDMMMNGDTLYAGSISNAFRMAIEAGNDILISSTTARLDEPLWAVNLALMAQDAAFRARVYDAAYRVIQAKLDYFKSGQAAPLYPDAAGIRAHIPDADGRAFFLAQACRSITAYKRGSLPVTPETGGRILACGTFSEYFAEIRKRYPGCGEFRYGYDPEPNEIASWGEQLARTAASYDTIIACVANRASARVVRYLQNSGKRVIVLSIMSPAVVLDFDWADAVLMGYSYSPYTFDALVGAAAGEFTPQGNVPFTVPAAR